MDLVAITHSIPSTHLNFKLKWVNGFLWAIGGIRHLTSSQSHNPTKGMHNFCCPSQKYVLLFLLLHFSNMVNWISPKLLTVFRTSDYLTLTFPENFWMSQFFGFDLRRSYCLCAKRPRRKSRGPNGL